jgi:hypothetical protein
MTKITHAIMFLNIERHKFMLMHKCISYIIILQVITLFIYGGVCVSKKTWYNLDVLNEVYSRSFPVRLIGSDPYGRRYTCQLYDMLHVTSIGSLHIDSHIFILFIYIYIYRKEKEEEERV